MLDSPQNNSTFSDENKKPEIYRTLSDNNFSIEYQILVKSVNSKKKKNGWKKPPAILTSILAFLNLLFLAVALRQCNTSDEGMRKGLRAYIYISDYKCRIEDGLLVFTYSIKNCGQTPAYNVRLYSEDGFNAAVVANQSTRPVESGDTLNARKMIIAPGNQDSNYYFTHRGIDTFAFFSLKRKKEDFYFWGTIEYSDIFSTKRHTKFMFILIQDDKGNFFLRPESYGNEAD